MSASRWRLPIGLMSWLWVGSFMKPLEQYGILFCATSDWQPRIWVLFHKNDKKVDLTVIIAGKSIFMLQPELSHGLLLRNGAPPMKQYGIGQSVPRFEDSRLLRGRGRFQDDRNLPGQAYGVVLRSPHAHARIIAIDTMAARAAPGVLAVYTGKDYAADGLGMPKATLPHKRPDGSPMFAPQRPALVADRVRYVGDPIAFVVAESLAEAKDASELIAVDYEPRPAGTNTAEAAQLGAAPVWDECPDNVSSIFEKGNKFAADAAFARAARIIKRRYVITRVHAQYMETRGALGVYDEGDERYTLYTDCQYPHRVRNMLCNAVFRIPESKMRVVSGDIGGAFGSKGWQYVEHRLVLWASRKLRRPIKWTCERSEAVLADEHGRDSVGEIELALDSDNKFLGLRVHLIGNIGAYVGSDGPAV